VARPTSIRGCGKKKGADKADGDEEIERRQSSVAVVANYTVVGDMSAAKQ